MKLHCQANCINYDRKKILHEEKATNIETDFFMC
jgi:hypothetical protein